MSGITLQAKAFKVSNRGGGSFRVSEKKLKKGGEKHKYYEMISPGTSPGSDYVHFICPKCQHRNKVCMYEAEAYIPSDCARIPFKCRMCRTTVEVEPPAKPMVSESLIVSPEQFNKEMAQRRKELHR